MPHYLAEIRTNDKSRGAGDSSGKTTWSGKAEREDHASFAGFVSYYLESLLPAEHMNHLETIPSVSDHVGNYAGSPTSRASHGYVELLLGGYSYGSLILARLPPVPAIIQRLETAEMGTAGAEIILRARTLAKQTRQAHEELQSPSSPRGRQLRPDDAATSPTKQRIGASPITIGGEETDPSSRRRSRDSRRSMDLVRKSVEMPQRIKAQIRRSSTPRVVSGSEKENATPISPSSESGPKVITRYLVISPVILPFTHTLCPPGPLTSVPGWRGHQSTNTNAGALFLGNPTLAIFGSTDVFTSSRRLKAWAEKMSKNSKFAFDWNEVDGAGHFWREGNAMQALQEKVAAWTKAH